MIVTNRQYEKEEEDFRGKKKKVSFGGASEHIKLMCDLNDEVIKSNREHEQQQIQDQRELEYLNQREELQKREEQLKLETERKKQMEESNQKRQEEQQKKEQEEQLKKQDEAQAATEQQHEEKEVVHQAGDAADQIQQMARSM